MVSHAELVMVDCENDLLPGHLVRTAVDSSSPRPDRLESVAGGGLVHLGTAYWRGWDGLLAEDSRLKSSGRA